MAQRPIVPKFGNWENEESVPYTVVFTNARKNRGGGKMINPNDPLENPDMFPNINRTSPPSMTPTRKKPEEPIARGAIMPTKDHTLSREDFDFQKSDNESSTQRSYGDSPMRSNGPARQSGTNAKSRLRPVTRGDEIPDRSSAVPRFGIWNDDDPQSAENFTQRFDVARRERNAGHRNISATPKHTSCSTPTRQRNNNHKGCCFPWF